MIAAARNGGAALATAPIICFTDADMQIRERRWGSRDVRQYWYEDR